MSTVLHAGLAAGRWQKLALIEQLANIGNEVGRVTRAKSIRPQPRSSTAS